MKILRNLCLHFARQIGQDRKNRKENHATKATKIQRNEKTHQADAKLESMSNTIHSRSFHQQKVILKFSLMIYSLDDLHHLGISYYVNFLGHLGKNGFQRRFGIHGN